MDDNFTIYIGIIGIYNIIYFILLYERSLNILGDTQIKIFSALFI